MSQFRLQATHISLTYPRCDISLEDLETFLRNKSFGSRKPIHLIISHETHEDGSPHRHAYIKYSAKMETRNARAFDFNGFHPNVQRTENVPAWINYVKKDGTFLEWTDDNYTHEESTTDLFEMARTYNYEDFFNYCMSQKIPYGYAQLAWNHTHSDEDNITIEEPPTEGTIDDILNNFTIQQQKTNVLVGPSGIGKTTFMLRNLPHPILLVSHLDQLRCFSSHRHRSILYDDVSFTHLPTTAQINIVDRYQARAIHRRYGVTTIPVGIVVGMTCNDHPLTTTLPQIARRINLLDLN